MKKNCFFYLAHVHLLSVLLTICTHSSLLLADGDNNYLYYELSGTNDEKVIIKLNADRFPLDTQVLLDDYQLTVRQVTQREAESHDRHFVVRGGTMTSEEDGDKRQRRSIETHSVAEMLQYALSLSHAESQSLQAGTHAEAEAAEAEAEAEAVKERVIDFAFQSGGNLRLMMDRMHRIFTVLLNEGNISGYRVRSINHYLSRRGALLVGVTTHLNTNIFYELLSQRFAGYFVPPYSERSRAQIQSTFGQIQLSIATNRTVAFNNQLTDLRNQMPDSSPPLQPVVLEEGEPLQYLYQVESTAQTSSSNSVFFVLSGSNDLENNPGRLPFRFTRIRNNGRLLAGLRIRLCSTVQLSDRGAAGGDEMSILYELLTRGETYRFFPPPDSRNYRPYGYLISFSIREDESVTGFVERVIGSLGRLSENQYFGYVVSGFFYQNEENTPVLRFAYNRFVRTNARQDRENRRFITHARDDPDVSEVVLYQPLSLEPVLVSPSAGIISRLTSILTDCFERLRVRVTETTTPAATAIEPENVVWRHPGEPSSHSLLGSN